MAGMFLHVYFVDEPFYCFTSFLMVFPSEVIYRPAGWGERLQIDQLLSCEDRHVTCKTCGSEVFCVIC